MRTYPELLKLTDNGDCKQKVEENATEIHDLVEQYLFGVGYEEIKPDVYEHRDFRVENVDGTLFDVYECGKFITEMTWIELIENLEHYPIKNKREEDMKRLQIISDEFDDLYKNEIVIGIESNNNIHVREDWFLETFEDYEIHRRNCTEYPFQLQTWREGYLYFCIVEVLPSTEEV